MKRATSGRRSSFSKLFPAALAVLLFLPTAGGAKPATGSKGAADDAVTLARRNADYRRLLDLASGNEFYIVLDPERKALRFMYKGNVLYEFEVSRLQVGTRRGLFGRGSLPRGWADSVWTEGRLDPPRETRMIELDTAAENYEEEREANLIPPTPEEAYPAPPAWGIHYREGLVLEFSSAGGGKGKARGPFRAMGGWVAGLFRRGGSGSEGIRLRVVLKGKDADFFYRAVPAITRFTLSRWP